MPEPWDFIEPSALGDLDKNATYAGVGRVLSEWGKIEVGLSYLYAILSGRPREGAAIREYGSKSIFSQRADDLCRIGRSYFVSNPDQKAEAEFDKLLRAARHFSARRNDVAHGIVRHLKLHGVAPGVPALQFYIPCSRPL